jgi:hypothetical protein
MGDMGIKLSQPNYDVKDAKDYKLIFSSSWPNLSIVASGTYTATNSTNTVFTHNLGYRPMYLVWELGSGTASFVNEYGGLFAVNSTTLRERGPNGLGGKQFYYQIYAVDLDTPFESSDVQLGTADDIEATIDKNFGIKATKPGKDIYSKDFRDYVIHSRTRSPMVGKILQFNSSLVQSIPHNYGYAPIAYLYGNYAGTLDTGFLTFYEIAPASSNGWFLATNSSTVEIDKSGTPDNVRVVVLKDPMILV